MQMQVEVDAARGIVEQAEARVAEANNKAAAAQAKSEEESGKLKDLQATLGVQAHQVGLQSANFRAHFAAAMLLYRTVARDVHPCHPLTHPLLWRCSPLRPQLVQAQRARDEAEARFTKAMDQLINAQTAHKKQVRRWLMLYAVCVPTSAFVLHLKQLPSASLPHDSVCRHAHEPPRLAPPYVQVVEYEHKLQSLNTVLQQATELRDRYNKLKQAAIEFETRAKTAEAKAQEVGQSVGLRARV